MRPLLFCGAAQMVYILHYGWTDVPLAGDQSIQDHVPNTQPERLDAWGVLHYESSTMTNRTTIRVSFVTKDGRWFIIAA
jgi:hypothetical protein